MSQMSNVGRKDLTSQSNTKPLKATPAQAGRSTHVSTSILKKIQTVPSTATPKKKVHFGDVTTFEFEIGYGGSSVPRRAAPPLGMVRHHHRVVVCALENHEKSAQHHRRKHRYTPSDAFHLLQRSKLYADHQLVQFAKDTNAINHSRRCSKYNIKPEMPRWNNSTRCSK